MLILLFVCSVFVPPLDFGSAFACATVILSSMHDSSVSRHADITRLPEQFGVTTGHRDSLENKIK